MDANGLKIGDWTFDYSSKTSNVYSIEKKQIINITEQQKGIVLAWFDIRGHYRSNVKSRLKWEPVHGEWMWFKSPNTMQYSLQRFNMMCPTVPTNYISIEGTISGSVEPYVGKLPKWCKYIDAKEKY